MPCYRICENNQKSMPDTGPSTDYNGRGALRKWWEDLDLQILLLYILFTQLYLHFCGRLRRKCTSAFLMIVNVWLLYLFSDLLATIALGKLSKIKVPGDGDRIPFPSPNATGITKNATENLKNATDNPALRVMWAPLILFYLGGPDTITVLRFEENHLWVRHFIGLLTQGLRTAYVLIVTWSTKSKWLSLAAILILIPGLIKYGERVFVVWSTSKDRYPGFTESASNETDRFRPVRSNSQLVLQACTWFQTLRPHCPRYKWDEVRVRALVAKFRELPSFDAFRVMEIELGFMYDLVFSKVGRIFTVWGSICRLLSFSLIVTVLVVFLLLKDKLPKGLVVGDHAITVVLLAGAILLDLAGIVAQLASDWALVWAADKNLNTPKWATDPVIFLHENLIDKSRQRWSGAMGQFSLQEFCTKYNPNVCINTIENLLGREKMLKIFCSKKSLDSHLKNLVFCETSGQATVDTSAENSNEKVTNTNINDLVQRFKWTRELGFCQCIVIWHAATEVCYGSDQGDHSTKSEAVKVLSDYMMYLVVVCPDRFPFCNKYDKITDKEDCADMKKLFDGEELEKKGDTMAIKLVYKAQRLVQEMKGIAEKWDIMASMWVEMMCFAASKCPVKNHIQELRHGGEFLTHVWLLLMHFGVRKEPEGSKESLKDECDSGLKCVGDYFKELEANELERHQGELVLVAPSDGPAWDNISGALDG